MVQIHSPRPLQRLTTHQEPEERLVAGQEVNDSNPFAATILSPLKSMRYDAFSTGTPTSFYGQCGQDLRFCLDIRSPD